MPPGVVPVRTSNFPIVAVARYVAIGFVSRQWVYVEAPLSYVETSRPLETAVSPFGVLIRMS